MFQGGRNLTIYLILSFSIFNCTAKNTEVKILPNEINILFAGEMNDISSDTKGGYAEVAFLLKQQRALPTPLFFFFSGGNIGPSKLSSFDRGSHSIDLLNFIEPDVMAINKRDFSFFEDELSLRSYEAAFPFVTSNIIEKETKLPLNGLFKSVITQQDNLRIGVLSTMNKSAVQEYNLKRINITDTFEAIKTQAKALRAKKVDLIVLIHSGRKTDVVNLLNDGTLDLILQKDSHARQHSINIPQNPYYIFVCDIDGLAIINLTGLNNKKAKPQIKTAFYKYSQFDKDSTMQNKVDLYKARLANLLDEDIGVTKTPINTLRSIVREKESAFGNLITDALVEYTEADIAIINGGSIRGETHYVVNQRINRRDVISELPHRSYAVVLNITGQQLKDAVEHSLTGINKGLGRFLQISKLNVIFDSKLPTGEKVISIKHNNVEIISTKMYKVAMSDYLANGGDDYTMWQGAENVKLSRQKNMLTSDIVINYIRQRGHISPKIENRLIDISATENNKSDKFEQYF